PPHSLTNAIVRRCTIAGVKSHFTYSHGFSATEIENCLVTDCGEAVYFEPEPAVVDNIGPVLIRSNQFLKVYNGISLSFPSSAQFDSVTCLGNEMVLNGAGGSGFAAC